jgi:hypothetical protein
MRKKNQMNLSDYPRYPRLCATDDYPAQHRAAFVFRDHRSQSARNHRSETAPRERGVGSVAFLGYLLLSLELHVHSSPEILKALILYGN